MIDEHHKIALAERRTQVLGQSASLIGSGLTVVAPGNYSAFLTLSVWLVYILDTEFGQSAFLMQKFGQAASFPYFNVHITPSKGLR